MILLGLLAGTPALNAQPAPDQTDNTGAPSDALPPNIYPTSPLAQVIRLAQAGVDEGIIMTYVTNSSSTFNLDSDKIIYLKDVGVPNDVVAAMMQRDQQLQQQMAATSYQPPPQAPPDETATPPDDNPPPVVDQPAPADQPAPTEVTVNYFYNTLAPYGTWVDVGGYGRCWRPSVVVYNSGWRPYCDHGHWVYTDCGWYWYSDYSWGWAPFHYGRWFLSPRWGWCWAPDTVWGPSWVTWRYSAGYCGWAPLPPFAIYRPGFGFFYRGAAVSIGFDFGLGANCFTFVSPEHFCDPHPRRYCAGPAQVTQIYHETTVYNNFNVNNRHVPVNFGISPERITAATGRPIRPVTIHDTGGPIQRGHRGDQLSRDGGTLIVSRPVFTGHSQPGGNQTIRPTPGHRPAQNQMTWPTEVRSAPPTQPFRQPQAPVQTPINPPQRNVFSTPPQPSSPPANYYSSPRSGGNSPIYSPRGWEQSRSSQPPRNNSYGSGAPTPAAPPANQRQSNPAGGSGGGHQPHGQNQGHNDASSGQRSNDQNQNNSGNGPGNGPGH